MDIAPDVVTQQALLDLALLKLKLAIDTLPNSVPEGCEDGPIAQYFSDVTEDEEGVWVTVDKALNRVFQVSRDEQLKLVTRGQHGMACVYTFLKYYADSPGISEHNRMFLMCHKVESLTEITSTV